MVTRSRSSKTPTKSTAINRDGNESHDALSSPIAKIKKMTKEEKTAARERARMAVIGTPSPNKKPPASSAKKSTSKKAKPAVVVKEERQNEEKSVEKKAAASRDPVENENSNGEDVGPPEKKQKSTKISEVVPTKDATITPKQLAVLKDAKKPKVVESQLKGMAKLLMVDLQKNDPQEVVTGIMNLQQSVLGQPIYSVFGTSPVVTKDSDLEAVPIVLLLTMRKWKNNWGVQFNGINCIGACASSSLKTKDTLIKGGAIAVVVNAMLQFHDSEDIQRVGCNVLATLSSCSRVAEMPADWSEALHQFVYDFDGVDLIVKALQVLKELPGSIADCARLLRNLVIMNKTDSEDIKGQIRKAGATTVVFDAMQIHSKHEKLLKYGGAFVKQFMG